MPFDPHRLKALRKKRKLSQGKLAKVLKINYQQIQDYETGKVRPGADRLEELVNALDTNMDYLMARSAFDGKRTPAHDELDTAFERGDINAILALIGKQVGEQKPPEKRASGSSPRAKKKLSLRR